MQSLDLTSGLNGLITLVCQVALVRRMPDAVVVAGISICNLRNSLQSSSVHMHTTGSTWDHYGLAPPSTPPPRCLCHNTTNTDRVLTSCHRNNTNLFTQKQHLALLWCVHDFRNIYKCSHCLFTYLITASGYVNVVGECYLCETGSFITTQSTTSPQCSKYS